MANLLTHDAYREMMRTQRARFVTIAALLLLFLGGLAALSLMPSYLLLRMNGIEVHVASVSSSSSTTQSITADRAVLARAQQHVTALLPFVASSTLPSSAILGVLNARGAGISIDHITYANDGKHGTIVVSGTAKMRQSVETFRQSLTSNVIFASVSIPVGALAGLGNGKFQATLTGNF